MADDDDPSPDEAERKAKDLAHRLLTTPWKKRAPLREAAPPTDGFLSKPEQGKRLSKQGD